VSERQAEFRLLFVCTGNTCRSPLAEALARREVECRGWTAVSVVSAGTGAVEGGPASEGALTAAESVGLELSDHRSQPLTSELVESADLVLAMGVHHLAQVIELGGAEKAALLSTFAEGDEEGIGWSVPDPFGAGIDVYMETLRVLGELVAAAIGRIEPVVVSSDPS
jgi:protein arginine phosphatase